MSLSIDIVSRITPACAGKTSSSASSPRCNADHPRVCGENVDLVLFLLYTGGSPPRVRGKLTHNVFNELSVRITPACAGKTANIRNGVILHEDHPRVCGENHNLGR